MNKKILADKSNKKRFLHTLPNEPIFYEDNTGSTVNRSEEERVFVQLLRKILLHDQGKYFSNTVRDQYQKEIKITYQDLLEKNKVHIEYTTPILYEAFDFDNEPIVTIGIIIMAILIAHISIPLFILANAITLAIDAVKASLVFTKNRTIIRLKVNRLFKNNVLAIKEKYRRLQEKIVHSSSDTLLGNFTNYVNNIDPKSTVLDLLVKTALNSNAIFDQNDLKQLIRIGINMPHEGALALLQKKLASQDIDQKFFRSIKKKLLALATAKSTNVPAFKIVLELLHPYVQSNILIDILNMKLDSLTEHWTETIQGSLIGWYTHGDNGYPVYEDPYEVQRTSYLDGYGQVQALLKTYSQNSDRSTTS